MSKLNLDEYTDKEIAEALLDLPLSKSMPIFKAVEIAIEKAQTRGETIAGKSSEDQLDEFVRRMWANNGNK